MNLPKEEEEQVKEGNILFDLLFFVLVGAIVIGLLYCIYGMMAFNIRDTYETNNNIIETTATIKDAYKYNTDTSKASGYYIMVSTSEYGKFEIPVSKYEFMNFKVNDTIIIKIKNNTASIIENNDQ
jgi:hypothetical protein